eukprot:m.43077 g.43077  ORF g.43077 m.43077 type:complete len:802 (-) comp11610_c0_seq2:431-2836(-)
MAQELWQSAVKWLRSVGVLPGDDPACSRNARVYDLALALQDGTMLCECLNKLKPGAIAHIHQKPEKQFLKMQNINSFLAACKTHFGLKEADLFTADQLYYASDFAKVVTTLSSLSQTVIAGIAGHQRFPLDAETPAHTAADEHGDDMYQSLEDLIGQSISLEEAKAEAAAYVDDDEDEGEEDIYGNIQTMVEEGGEEVYTDLMYNDGDDIYSPASFSPDDKRNCVLAELLDTERNFVKVLHSIVDVYHKHLSESKAFSKLDVSTVFSNIAELLTSHKELITGLEKQMASTTGRMVSQVFAEHLRSLRCYGKFCCEIPSSIAKLKELEAKPATARVLEAAKKASGQRFPLKDLLNVPMQRILKYPLLLKELIKATPAEHPDTPGLHAAMANVQELAKFINEEKKNHDNLKNMISSLRQYSGKPLHEYGSLVKDGDLMHKPSEAARGLKLRFFFLFSTGIIACKPKGVQYTYKFTIDLDERDWELEDVQFWKLPKEEQNGKYTYPWAMKCKNKGKEAVHIFSAKTLASKKKWMSLMQFNLDAIKDSKAAAPEVAPRTGESTLERNTSIPAPTTTAGPAAAAPKKKQSYEQWVIGQGPPSTPAAPPPSQPLPPPPSAAPGGFSSNNSAWFAGKMPRAKAEKVLESMHDGTYLARESDSRPGDYSLSVKYGVVKHIKINRHGNRYAVAPDAKAFPSIEELVDHFQEHSLNRHFPGMETTLAIPFKHAGNRASTKAGSSGTSYEWPGGVCLLCQRSAVKFLNRLCLLPLTTRLVLSLIIQQQKSSWHWSCSVSVCIRSRRPGRAVI